MGYAPVFPPAARKPARSSFAYRFVHGTHHRKEETMNQPGNNQMKKSMSSGVVSGIAAVVLCAVVLLGRSLRATALFVPIIFILVIIMLICAAVNGANKKTAARQRPHQLPYNAAPYPLPQQAPAPRAETYNPFELQQQRGHSHATGSPEHGAYGGDLTAPSYQVWNPLGDKDPWDGPKDRDPWDI